MKIIVFEGNSGDCLLLNSAGNKNVLVDGGLVRHHFGKILSYQFNVAPTLGQMRENGEKLDLVCVSHIDQDHIGGILTMLNDEFDWRVFEHQKAQGLNPEPPRSHRPPEIATIWHNAFHEQIGQDRGELENALRVAAAASLALGGAPLSHGYDIFSRLATSMKEAAQVSRRIGAKQLGIPLNPEFGGKLVRRHSRSKPIELGDLKITVLGPNTRRLKELEEKWESWLESVKGQKQIRSVRRQAGKDEDALIASDLAAYLALADLGPAVGNRDDVTAQNVSSITMMVEECAKKVLLTGDARDDDVVDDLIGTGLADNDGHIHVDVLKVPHHGSENNFSLGFAQHVTADHYVFCGNGGHENPDHRVVERLLDARIGPASKRTGNPEADRPFKIWFTSDGTTFKADRHHMEDLKTLVKSRQNGAEPKMEFFFSGDRHFELTI